MPDLKKMELALKIGDCADRLLTLQERQNAAISGLLQAVEEYRVFLEKASKTPPPTSNNNRE